MDLLDLVIILFAASAVVGGYRLGFLARVASWIGLAVGLALAAHFLPDVVDALRGSSPATKPPHRRRHLSSAPASWARPWA